MGYGRASPQLLLTAAGSPQRKLLLFVVRCMTCDIHWIMAVKAGFAQRQITRHGLQIPGVHITQESAPIMAQISSAVWEEAINCLLDGMSVPK